MYIYKFEHNGETYIGSTKNFKERCWAHNQHMKQDRHNKTCFYQYCLANDITDIRPYCKIIQKIENIYDKDLLRYREQEVLNILQPTLNTIRAVNKKRYKNILKNNLF